MEEGLGVSSNLMGFIRSLRKEGRPGLGDRTMVGEISFGSPLVVERSASADDPATKHQLRFGRVRIRAEEVAESEVQTDFGLPFDGHGHMFIDTSERSPTCTLTLVLAPERFQALWDLPQPDVALRLDSDVLGTGYNRPLVCKDSSASAQVKGVRLSLVAPASIPADWFSEGMRQDLRDAWEKLHFGGHSQMSKIVAELGQSAAASIATWPNRSELYEHIEELVSEARGAFKEPLNLEPASGNGWYEPKDKFTQLLGDFDEKKQRELRANYDHLWQHFTLAHVVQKGEALVGARASGMKSNADEFDEVAHRLLSRPEVSSPTLEWALIDALVHAECLGLAQIVHSNKTMLGMPLATPLEGAQAAPGAMRQWLKGLGELFVEGLKLVATFFLAFALTQGEPQSAWIVTTGITVARWLRKAILWKQLNPPKPGAELLLKMATFYELFKRPDFNAGAARDQLYRLSAEGAIFSPWVASLLDARARREARQA